MGTALVDGDGVRLFAHRVGVGGSLGVLVKVVQGGPLGGHQRGVEGLVLGLIEGAVEVIRLAPAVAGGREHLAVVEALGGDDGGHRVVEVQAAAAGQPGDLPGQGPLGQGAGGDEDRRRLVDGGRFLPADGDVGVRFHQSGDPGAEGVPVDGQGPAGGHPDRLGGGQQARAHPAHLLLQKAGGGVQPLGLEAVGADQLGKAGALVGRGKMDGLLLVQGDLHPPPGQPEGGLAPGQARPDDRCLQYTVHPFYPLFLGTGISKPQPSLAQ